MAKNYYKEIKEILKSGILLEDRLTIQRKMIELSKMHDVNAMKTLYLLIRLQPTIAKNNKKYLITNLDYQDVDDKSTIYINLANNTVKAAYRLLYSIITSYYIDPNIKDKNKSNLYGYLMAHLADIYRADNNFHSMIELEKLMVCISKTLAMLYPLDVKKNCYRDKNRNKKSFEELLCEYRKINPYYLKESTKEVPSMKEILNNIGKNEFNGYDSAKETQIRNKKKFKNDPRFSKEKRYNFSTYEFVKKNM